jgi:hypothetical protein
MRSFNVDGRVALRRVSCVLSEGHLRRHGASEAARCSIKGNEERLAVTATARVF